MNTAKEIFPYCNKKLIFKWCNVLSSLLLLEELCVDVGVMMSSFRASKVGGDNGTVVMMHHLMHAGGRLFNLVCYPRKGDGAWIRSLCIS